MTTDSKGNLNGLAAIIRELYGPDSKFDRDLLAARERHSDWLKKMAAPKSPAERARDEKKRAEEAAAAEKRAATPVLTEAEKRMFAGAAGGGKSFEFPPFDASTAAIWYDEIGRHMPPPTPPPGLPPAHPPAWLNGFVDRLTAIDRALAALSARLDLIDSTVLNIQQELRRDRT